MAELTAEEQILQLQKELAESKKALTRAKDKGVVAMPVSGSYTAKWKDDATGKSKTKKVEFVDGSAKVRLLNGQIVSSEGVLQIANGDAPSPALLLKFPLLKELNEEAAQALLTHYAKIGAGFLK